MRTGMLLVGLLVACGGPKSDTTVKPLPTPDEPAGSGTTTTAPPATGAKAIETPALIAKALPNDPAKVTIHRLSNGMTVYISPDPQEPSIVAHIAVRAGSRHDPANSTGLAHYLEHMLFKGTTRLGTLDYAKEKPHLDKIAALYAQLRTPGADTAKVFAEIDKENKAASAFSIPNELDQLYARIGVTGLNAFTSNDTTVYVGTIPKNRIAQWARVEAARYSDPVFRLFWPELEAVYEEKNRALDNPGRRVNEAMMLALFPKHGYGYSTGIGEVEHLKKPAYDDMVAFFNRYYTPGNMAIMLSGDVDESVLPLLEKEFGAFKRPAGAAVDPGEQAKIARRTELTVKVPSNEGVVMAWPLVAAAHPDRNAIAVMDLLLDDGKSGILRRDLLLTQKVANGGSNPQFLREAGWFTLRADALAGQDHAALETLLLGVADKIKKGDFTDTDLATALLTYEIDRERSMESNDGRMTAMQSAFVDGVPWADEVNRMAALKKVTKADVMRVANKYLGPGFVIVKKVKGPTDVPKITKPAITAVQVDPSRQSAFAKSILDMPITAVEPVSLVEGKDYERGKLATGSLVTVKNQRNGLFTLVHEYELGRTDDRLTCLALEVMRVSGAGKLTAEQLVRKLHELGVTVDTRCGKTSSAIVLSGIDKNLEPAMALLRDWLADPAIDEPTLKARVATTLTERSNSLTSPQAIAGASASFARFGADSDLLVVATNKQLEAAKPAQLRALLARYLTTKHRTSYFGPRTTAEASKVITLGDGKVAAKAPRPTKFRKPNTLLVVEQATAQTHVWLVWPRKPANDADRAAGELFSEYTSPILYQEVREARGLAYTVFGGFGASPRKIDEASVFAYVGTQSDKTHDALDSVLETINKPVDANRLALTKETIAQSYRVDRIPPRAIPGAVYTWDDQGEKSDPRAKRTERTLALDAAALEKWRKAALTQQVIVSITGKRDKLDDARLKKLAPITVVPVEKLFGY